MLCVRRVGTQPEQVPSRHVFEHDAHGRQGQTFNYVSELEVGTSTSNLQQNDGQLLMTDGELGSLQRASQQDANYRWLCALRPIRAHNIFVALSEDIGDIG